MIQMIWLMLSLVSLHSAIKKSFYEKKKKKEKVFGWLPNSMSLDYQNLIYM